MTGTWLGGGRLQQDLFAKRMVELGFDGDALSIFGVMDEDGKGLSRNQFITIMTGRGSAFTSIGSQVTIGPAKGKEGGFSNTNSSESIDGIASEHATSKFRGHSGARENSPKCSKRDISPSS